MSKGVLLLFALAMGRQGDTRRECSWLVVVGACFLFVGDIERYGGVCVMVSVDRWSPWSEAVGSARRAGVVARPLLGPYCFVGKDGSAPMMGPWELGRVSDWDTHGCPAATPQVSIRAWITCTVARP